MNIDRAFWELPPDHATMTDEQWHEWHTARAAALGARDGDGCHYDADLADEHLAFFRCLKLPNGPRGTESFEPMAWQEHQIIRPLFGYLKADGCRRFQTVFVAIPKKNGKTGLAAGIALDLLWFDGEPGAQVYGAAKDSAQAEQVWLPLKAMIEESPAMAKRLEVVDSRKRVNHKDSRSFYQVLAADKGGAAKHGLNTHGIVIDEEHAIRDTTYLRTLRFGAGDARRQPVFFIITTAGNNRATLCYDDWTYAREVRDGTKSAPTWLPVIYETPEDADWTDEDVWRAANPSIGVTIDIDKVREAFRECKDRPNEENTFRQLRLNQWVSNETRFLPMMQWDACGPTGSARELAKVRDEMMAELEGQPCIGWLDLSSTLDMTTFGLLFPRPDGYAVLPWFFLPEANIAERSELDQARYEEWAREGFLTLTPGSAVNQPLVRQHILALSERFPFRTIAYDDYEAWETAAHLDEAGFTMYRVPPQQSAMNVPTKELLRLVIVGQIQHGGNPVLRWNADNLAVKSDESNRIRPVKPSDNRGARVDGVVGLIMALSCHLSDTDDPAEYVDGGLILDL